VTKFVAYVAWIFFYKKYKFNGKICYKCEDTEYLLRGCFNWCTLYMIVFE